MKITAWKWPEPAMRIFRPKGFTFIELMVVVAILAILIAIVAPRIMGRTDEARQTATLLQLRNLEQALQLYNLDNGFFPTTEQGLHALVVQPSTGKIPLHWKEGGYLAKVPMDAWGRPFMYLSPGGQEATGSLREYDLLSYGADGEPGGKGKHADVTSWNIDAK